MVGYLFGQHGSECISVSRAQFAQGREFPPPVEPGFRRRISTLAAFPPEVLAGGSEGRSRNGIRRIGSLARWSARFNPSAKSEDRRKGVGWVDRIDLDGGLLGKPDSLVGARRGQGGFGGRLMIRVGCSQA